MNAQNSFFCIALIFLTFQKLTADTITQSNGRTIEGQTLKVSETSIIIEVQTDKEYVISTRSIPREEVKNIIDENNMILFEDNRLLVKDLSDYYSMPNPYKQVQTKGSDTLVTEDGQVIIGNINNITTSHITYAHEHDQSKLYMIFTDKIASINGQDMNKIRNEIKQNTPPPAEKVFSYPLIGIEMGLTGIFNQLNQYQNTFDDLSQKLDFSGYHPPHMIDNPIFTVNLGLMVKINRHISLSARSHFTLGFGDNEDYSEDSESFRLFLADVQYLYPLNSFSPWIGLGFAFQSITIINRYNRIDVKFKSQENTILYEAGFDFEINTQLNFVFALRYLPFGEKEITIQTSEQITGGYRIDLSNLMISAGFVINL